MSRVHGTLGYAMLRQLYVNWLRTNHHFLSLRCLGHFKDIFGLGNDVLYQANLSNASGYFWNFTMKLPNSLVFIGGQTYHVRRLIG